MADSSKPAPRPRPHRGPMHDPLPQDAADDHDAAAPPLRTDTTRAFLAPGEYADSHHPAVRALAGTLAGTTAAATAVALFRHVRDLPYEADDFEDLETYRASSVLAAGHGYCVSKASLLVALARAAGVPARLAFADVRNHLASPRLRRAMGTDTFAWHGYAHLRLGDRWVAVSPTFDPETCRRAGVAPLDFDGEHDALLQSFDGRRTMAYVTDHGTFHDVPARFLAAEMPRLYPFTRAGGIDRYKAGTRAGAGW